MRHWVNSSSTIYFSNFSLKIKQIKRNWNIERKKQFWLKKEKSEFKQRNSDILKKKNYENKTLIYPLLKRNLMSLKYKSGKNLFMEHDSFLKFLSISHSEDYLKLWKKQYPTHNGQIPTKSPFQNQRLNRLLKSLIIDLISLQ